MAIQLPALDIQPPQQQPGVLDQYAKGVQLKSLLQQQQMGEMQLQEAKQQQADEQVVMKTLAAHQGNIESALPDLAGKVTPKTLMGLQKYNLETRKTYAEIDDKELATRKYQNDTLAGLVTQAQQLSPEQYAASWPQIAASASQINPKIKLDPSKPVPQETLGKLSVGLQTNDQFLKQEADKRAAEASKRAAEKDAAMLPGEVAKSTMAVQEAAMSPQERAGLKGDSQVGFLSMKDWLAKHPGKGPSDYEKAKAGWAPAARIAIEGAAGPAVDLNDPSVQGVASGKLKISDVMTYRTPIGQRKAFIAAVQQVNPNFSSKDYDVEKAVEKAFTSGKPAEELASFNTAIAHADLLKQAGQALQSGDNRTINNLANKLKTEFGVSGPTDYKVIENAYTREVTKALTAGHITDAEVASAGATIPANASNAQRLGAIDAYKKLMQSKVKIRKDQFEQGMKAKPNFGDQSSDQQTAPKHQTLAEWKASQQK